MEGSKLIEEVIRKIKNYYDFVPDHYDSGFNYEGRKLQVWELLHQLKYPENLVTQEIVCSWLEEASFNELGVPPPKHLSNFDWSPP